MAAEPVPYHVIEDVALELYLAAGGNAPWEWVPRARRESYRDMAEAAIEAAEPYLRRKARAELLEELADGLLASVSDRQERTATRNVLTWFGPVPFSSSLATSTSLARTLYRRAKEERRGR